MAVVLRPKNRSGRELRLPETCPVGGGTPWRAGPGLRGGRQARGPAAHQGRVGGALHVQDEPGGRAQAGAGARADELLLVELLLVAAAGEVGMQRAAWPTAAVLDPACYRWLLNTTAVPGLAGYQHLVGVGSGRIRP